MNRTIMELRQGNEIIVVTFGDCMNRTIMELRQLNQMQVCVNSHTV